MTHLWGSRASDGRLIVGGARGSTRGLRGKLAVELLECQGMVVAPRSEIWNPLGKWWSHRKWWNHKEKQ